MNDVQAEDETTTSGSQPQAAEVRWLCGAMAHACAASGARAVGSWRGAWGAQRVCCGLTCPAARASRARRLGRGKAASSGRARRARPRPRLPRLPRPAATAPAVTGEATAAAAAALAAVRRAPAAKAARLKKRRGRRLGRSEPSWGCRCRAARTHTMSRQTRVGQRGSWQCRWRAGRLGSGVLKPPPGTIRGELCGA